MAPLAGEVVQRILAYGNRAPSAGFTQGYGFLVLEGAADRARFWQAFVAADHEPEPAEMAAPLLIVPLADPVLVYRHWVCRAADAAYYGR